MMRILLLVPALMLTAAPSLAKDGKKTPDPNRVICRTTEQVGSRLQTKKTCMTAMQWSQMQRETRDTVERVQAYKPHTG